MRRHQLVALEDRVVLVQVQHDAGVRQRAEHLLVALARGGLVVVVGIDRLHAELAGQPRDLVDRRAVAHDQPDPLDAVGASQTAQLFVEVEQRLVDELDPPVGLRPRSGRRLRMSVSNTNTHQTRWRAWRSAWWSAALVARAQVAPEPNQSAVSISWESGSCRAATNSQP